MGDEHSIEKECQTNTRFANMNTSLKNNSYVIFDFSDPQTTSLWKPLNDVIMGGRSAGTMKQASPTSAVFTGVVSLEQGGGFASVRALPAEYNLEGLSGLILSLRGDGKSYKINLTDNQGPRDVLHQDRFETRQNEWVEIRIPFTDLVPTFRGRRIQNHKPLDTGSVRTFGLMISEKQAGEFSLEVAFIAANK